MIKVCYSYFDQPITSLVCIARWRPHSSEASSEVRYGIGNWMSCSVRISKPSSLQFRCEVQKCLSEFASQLENKGRVWHLNSTKPIKCFVNNCAEVHDTCCKTRGWSCTVICMLYKTSICRTGKSHNYNAASVSKMQPNVCMLMN